ncbi:MAG: apolipoprotein N-acyltransferase, partial [Rickettsiales bacterium]|nr:apolipoprotein N-acyltransferase [Rickettsiales bacterium]
GAVRGEIENDKISKVWNSIFIFKNNEIIDYYDKTVLVPFGEYIPFSKYIPFISKITNGGIDFSKGEANKTITINGIKISPIICYEIIFPNKVIDKNERPDVIINLTNDGWFGTSSGPYQHLIAAKFRAIENKIPIIRVSNSGISAYIDEYGRIVKRTKLNEVATIDLINK